MFESHLGKCLPPAISPQSTSAKNLTQVKKKKFWHKCDSCDFTARMIKEMTSHKAKCHGLKVIPCKECDYLARNKSKLNRHIGYRHSKNKLAFSGNIRLNVSGTSSPSTSVESKMKFGEKNEIQNILDSQTSNCLSSYEHTDFKLSKCNNVFDAKTFSPNLFCKLCTWHADNEEQVFNHLQNIHIPNHCIEHEIQTVVMVGKRKSCETSLYKCTNCNYSSEQKMSIIGHIIDSHPSFLISVQPGTLDENLSNSFATSFFTKGQPEKTYAYSCSDCMYKTNFKRNLKLHRTHHGADAPFRCTHCNFAAFHEIAVSRHRNNYHVVNVGKINSPMSETKSFYQTGTSIKHISSKCSSLPGAEHRLIDKKKCGGKIWHCPHCRNRKYCDHRGLMKHMRIKHNHSSSLVNNSSFKKYNSLKCSGCPYVARSHRYLKAHMQKRKHEGTTKVQFLSHGETSDSASLNIISNYVESEIENIANDSITSTPQFKCDHCPVTFNTYQAIAVHTAKAHKNEVVYKCHYCIFTSNRKYLLRNHLLQCSRLNKEYCNEEQMKCGSEVSGKTRDAEDAVDNMYNEENISEFAQSCEKFELVKYYGCSKCAYKTFRNFNLKKHIKLIHKGAKVIEILCQEEGSEKLHAIEKDFSEALKDENGTPASAVLDMNRSQVKSSKLSNEIATSSTGSVGGHKVIIDNQEQVDMSSILKRGSDESFNSDKQANFYNGGKRTKVYKCLFCPKVTRGWNHYILHRKMHFSVVGSSKNQCKYCSYCSSSSKFLKKHEMLHKEHLATTETLNDLKKIHPVEQPPGNPLIPPDFRVKSGYQCDSCPFRAKDLKTFQVHKNLHNPRETRYRCTKCTYAVNCTSKLKVHAKVHTFEYILSNYKSVHCKENKDTSKLPQATFSEPYQSYSSITEAIHDKSKHEEVEDSMEVARTKHQLVVSKKTHFQTSSFTETWLDKNMPTIQVQEDDQGKDNSDENSNGSNSFSLVTETKDGCKAAVLLKSVSANVDLWHCERCPFVEKDAGCLQRHVSMHINRRYYECMYCNYSAPTYYYLIEHSKLHQTPNPNLLFAQSTNNLQCLEEGEKFQTIPKQLNKNLYENSPEFTLTPKKMFNCTYCPFSFKLRMLLVQHIKGHVNKYEFNCLFCTFSSDKANEIKEHTEVHFNLPGSEMNAYLGSSSASEDRNQSSAKGFVQFFMESISDQFVDVYCSNDSLYKLDVNLKANEERESLTITSDTALTAKKENIQTSLFSNFYAREDNDLCSKDSETVNRCVNESKCNRQDVKHTIMSNDLAANRSADLLCDIQKDDEEDEYIEIDATDEIGIHNNDDDDVKDLFSKNVAQEHFNNYKELNCSPIRKKNRSDFSHLRLPWTCRYCGRNLKCFRSLVCHESAHLSPCAYLKNMI